MDLVQGEQSLTESHVLRVQQHEFRVSEQMLKVHNTETQINLDLVTGEQHELRVSKQTLNFVLIKI